MRFQRTIRVSLFSILFLVFGFQVLEAQSRSELEARRLEIIKRIEQADKDLSRVANSRKSTLKEFQIIERKIRDRERLVSSIQNELVLAEEELLAAKSKTFILEQDLDGLKEKYYSLLNAAYKQHLSFNKWAFIFNSNSINDSFQRWKYIKQYEAYCRDAYLSLKSSSVDLMSSVNALDAAVADRKSLLDQEKKQFAIIQEELLQKDEILSKLRLQESELTLDLQDRKVEREKLNSAIENVIIAALKGETNVESTVNNNASLSFGKFKAKLPWPIDAAVISGRFGKQKHPTLKDIYIINNGIDIEAQGELLAKCVFAGEVVGVNTIPGFGRTIIVKHGTYYTVYSKLETVYVTTGASVDQFAELGTIAIDKEGARTLHFEVWEGKTKKNPINWLKK